MVNGLKRCYFVEEFFIGEVGWLTALILVFAGIVVVFTGKTLLKLVIGGAFGVLLGYIVAKLVLIFNGGFVAALVLGFISFIIGFFLGWFIFKLAIAIITGFIIGLLMASIFGLFSNIPLLVITVLLSIGISYLLAEKIISVITLFAGLALFFTGIYHLIDNLLISILATTLLFIFVILDKIRGKKSRKSS